MSPVDIVTTYLRLVERRQLEEAARHLADDVEIIFPGGRRFSNLDEQVASSRKRYRGVTKFFDQIDVMTDGNLEIVYVSGTLEGSDLSGRHFDSVRFIDRFELVDGLITTHQVWNDMAETVLFSSAAGGAIDG